MCVCVLVDLTEINLDYTLKKDYRLTQIIIIIIIECLTIEI